MQNNELKQLQCDLVNETINFYTEDPSRRAVLPSGRCEYMADNGNKCAVGRIIDWKKLEKKGFSIKNMNLAGSVDVLHIHDDNDEREIDDIHEVLLDKYKKIPLNVLADLQTLHDLKKFWESTDEDDDNNTPTQRREKEIIRLRSLYCQ